MGRVVQTKAEKHSIFFLVLVVLLLFTLMASFPENAFAGTSAAAIKSNIVEVTFPQEVTEASAENVSNYTITGGPEGLVVESAVLQSVATKVYLTTSVQAAGTAYTLKVTGISYQAGGSLPEDGVQNVAQFSGYDSGTGLVKPEIIGVQGSTGAVTLTWLDDPSVVSYEVYRSTDGQNWTLVTSGGGIETVTDTGLTDYVNYFYKVRATDGSMITESSIARAFPPSTSPHGFYGVDTSPCAACHITHAAMSPYLLGEPSSVTLCLVCHDGTQSKYDVLGGQVLTNSGYKLSSGGPFGTLQPGASTTVHSVYTPEPFNYSGSETPANIPTSIHNVGLYYTTAPGNFITSTNKLESPLECISCHNPHNYENYRMLRQDLDVRYGAEENVFRAYAITSANGESIRYVTGAVRFCGYCHSDFNQGSGSGSTYAQSTQQPGYKLSEKSLDTTMHAVNVMKSYKGRAAPSSVDGVEIPYEQDKIICMTCHRAHGTVVPGSSPVRNSGYSTSLKRIEYMYICEQCHDMTNNPY